MTKLEIIKEFNIMLSKKQIDERLKPLIKLYILGKAMLEELTLEQIQTQLDALCSRIKNVEFSSSNKIVTAYENKSEVLTINKQLFLDGRADEVILPVFMKFEQALKQDNRKTYGNHIEDFIHAGRIAKTISIPISERLYKLYELSEYSYGDIEYKIDELVKDDTCLKVICSKYNSDLNYLIVTGTDNQKDILNGARLFHNEVFTEEALNNPDFEGPYKTKEYQEKASKILACIYTIKPLEYSDDFAMNKEMDAFMLESLVKNIKLFTGCTNEDIELAKSQKYAGDSRISNSLEETIKNTDNKAISEQFIVDKVQEVLDKKPDWDSRVKHLIIPFFIRSQRIYNWDIDEFQERLNELDLKIDKIIFEDLGRLDVLGTTALDSIKLNSRVFFDRKRKICMACSKNSFS